MRRKFIYILLPIIIILIGVYVFIENKPVSKTESATPTKDKLNVQASWILNGEFANICSAIVEGYYDEENLDVTLIPGGPSGANFIVATTAVAQDPDLDIGIDGDLVPLLRGVSKENPHERLEMKAFAYFWNENPYGFLVKTDSGISSLKDFGKRKSDGSKVKIGVTADFVLQSALAKYAGVNEKDLDFVTVGFDATPLISGQVDALAGYWTTQAYELEKAGISYNFLGIGELPGFNQPSMIAVAKENTISTKRSQLERWLKATIRGSQFVIDSPERAASDVLDPRCGGPSLNIDQETWLIKKSIPLFDRSRIGNMDLNVIEGFANAYKDLGQIQDVPDTSQYVDVSFLSSVYSQ